MIRLRSPVLAAALWSASCAQAPLAPNKIIFMLADGAGIEHWTLAAFASESLSIRAFPTIGLIDTRGSDHVVTGSAPGATAYAIGERSFMGAVGVAGDSLPRESVLERAIAGGRATGLITTTFLVDASPASFAAHNVHRYELLDIATQMGEAGVTVMMGGGRRAFSGATRRDSVDLIADLRERYAYVESADQLRALNLDTVATLVGLFADGEMGVVSERSPALPAMVAAALAVLDRDPDGFFLFVENEESDTQAHRNAPPDVIEAEMLDFDAAIRVAMAYRQMHPETLIIVTSDHETGGMALNHDENRNVVLSYTTPSHTGALVPIFAIGPGAEQFGGILENREVGRRLMGLVGGSLAN